MTENEEFYKLTFSQREGKAPLPELMRLEHVSKDFRNLVWLAVDNEIQREMIFDMDVNAIIDAYEEHHSMYHIVSDYTFKVLHYPHDHIDHKPTEHQDLLREIILERNYDIVLTLVEFIARPQPLSETATERFEKCFQRSTPCLYRSNY